MSKQNRKSRDKNKRNVIKENHFNLMDIYPKTDNQEVFFNNYESNKSQLLLGYPGTGKTFMAMQKSFEEIGSPASDYSKLVIVRSAVPTRDLGFLPGTLEEKAAVYELPYSSICTELFGRGDAYSILKKRGTIDFITTSFIRGITLEHAIVIVDEFENMTTHEASSLVTRIGQSCKIIFCGDLLQTDFTRADDKDIGTFIKIVKSIK